MKKSKVLMFCAIGSAIGLLTGCDSMQRAARVEPAKVSSFIPKPELLVPQQATFPFHYFYLKKDAGQYDNVYIAPVNISYLRSNTKNWAKLDEKMAKRLGSDISKIAAFTGKAFREEFSKVSGAKKLAVVDSPKYKRTLSVEIAIVAIVPTKAELNVLGTAGNLLLPGIGIITGQLAGGSVTIEGVIRDAQTGEIISMFANTEKDQRAILNIAGMTWYTSAENNIRIQAGHVAKVFSGADYSRTYRRLIKLVAF